MLTPNHHQISGIKNLRTNANLPGAQDVEAMNNRTLALEWLYRISGRTCGTYTGLWDEFLAFDHEEDL